MKRLIPLLAGVAVLLVSGCASTGTTISQVATSQFASTGATADSTPSRAANALQEQLRQAEQRIEAQHNAHPNVARECITWPLVVSAPTDLSGFTAGRVKVQNLNSLGAGASVRLADPGAAGRWLDFWQGMGCYGALVGPPEGAKDIVKPREIQVPGIDSGKTMPQIESWTEVDGSTSITLRWNSDAFASPNIGYSLIGHNVDAETITRIAGSVEPVQ